MKKNKDAFWLIIAMWLVLVMTLLVLYILEYIIPYSKNVKWIENSSNAFYQAENSIEEGLYFFKTRSWSTKFSDKTRDFKNPKVWVDYKYETISTWSLIPYNWEWNSSYSWSYNTIFQWNPIQLSVWGNVITANLKLEKMKFSFQVPNLKPWNTTLSGSNIPIINWQLSSNTDTLNASWSWILTDDLWITDTDIFDWSNRNNKNVNYNIWQKLNWDEGTIENFYDNNCTGTSSWCSLKFSIVNKLELKDEWTRVPYLEYKIKTDTKIPLRYSMIKAYWKSYGFQKYLEIKIPQSTTNEAFDFSIFQ
jgi:hypothetical protein